MGREEENLARETWALLTGAMMAMRPVWLAAGHAEGLTPPQAMTLMKLSPEKAPSLGEVARYMRCDASAVTALADRLEELGLATRRVSATDRRVKELVPTEAGLAAQDRLREAFLRPPPALQELPPDELRLLHEVAVRLAEDAGEGAMPWLAPPRAAAGA